MIKKMMLVFTLIFFASSVFGQSYKYDIESIKKRSKKQLNLIQRKLKEQRIEEAQAKKAKKIQDIFNQAEELYQQGKLKEAKELYEKAYKLSDDKSMRQYIKRANKAIAKQKRKEREAALVRKKEEREKKRRLAREQKEKVRLERERQKQLAQEKKEQERLKKQEELTRKREERERQKKLLREQREKELARQRKLREEIDSLYRQAIDYYRDEQFGQAKQAFKKILSLDPEGRRARAASTYLETRISNKIEQLEQEKQREKINSLYDQGKAAYSKENFGQAESLFKQILEINPEHSRAKTYLNTHIPNKKQQLKEQAQKEKEHLERKMQKELERHQRKKQEQLKRQRKEKERRQREGARKEEERKKRLEKEKIKKSRKAAQVVTETAKDSKWKLGLKLEDMTYKTEEECLGVLGKKPDDKEAFDNLVNLYLLRDELLDEAKELYRNRSYREAVKNYEKALLIEPDNKEAKKGIKRARSRMK